MSSKIVRDIFRTWAATLTTPFVETINKAASPNQPIWFTLRFSVYSSERLTYCTSPREEEGGVTFVYSARPGTGDAAVLAAVEADIAAMLGKIDPTGQVVITDHEAPDDFSDGDADTHYRVFVTYEYTAHT